MTESISVTKREVTDRVGRLTGYAGVKTAEGKAYDIVAAMESDRPQLELIIDEALTALWRHAGAVMAGAPEDDGECVTVAVKLHRRAPSGAAEQLRQALSAYLTNAVTAQWLTMTGHPHGEMYAKVAVEAMAAFYECALQRGHP